MNDSLLVRLCEAIEAFTATAKALHEDLRPELKCTETFRRKRQEQEELERAASDFVKKSSSRPES